MNSTSAASMQILDIDNCITKDLPQGWISCRLKRICSFAYGDSLPSEMRSRGSVAVFGSNGQVGYHTNSNTNAPCIIVGRKGSFGKIHYSTFPVFAIDTSYFIDERHTSANIRWLYYLLITMSLDEISKDSAIPGLNREDAYQLIVLFPTLQCQNSIARYLDYFCFHLIEIILHIKNLLEHIEEYKRTAIQHSVTRGLDPDVPLKPSGVEWLGDIPEHWEVRRLRTLAKIINGATPSTQDPLNWDGDIGWLTPEDLGKLTTRYVHKGSRGITLKGYESCGATLAPSGSLAISTRAPIGHIGILQQEACVNQGCRLLTPSDLVESAWLYFSLRAFNDELSSLGQGSTFTELSRDKLGDFAIALPPLSEQVAIVSHLDNLTSDIDVAIAHTRREIELLEEYRTRLIADVVTGKLDVREAAANLPDVSPDDLKPLAESSEADD